jgi:hypothetical protein
MLSRPATWSPYLMKPSSRLIPGLLKWLGMVAEVAATAAGAAAVAVAAVDAAASLLTMLPLVATDAGEAVTIRW